MIYIYIYIITQNIHSLSNKQYGIISNRFIVYIQVYELISSDNNNDEYIYFKIELYFDNQQEQYSFYDKIILKHLSKDLIFDTIKALFTAFDCDNFIEFNNDYNQFKFCFINTEQIVKCMKTVSLKRLNRSKDSAIKEVKNRYNKHSIPNIENIDIKCINLHEIDDPNFDGFWSQFLPKFENYKENIKTYISSYCKDK